jgi:SIR2-like domain
MLPPLVKLGTSATPGESKYVCLAGAGLSKDAGLPTAWDLMLETAALLRVADEDDGNDLQTWFLNSRFKDLRYSELIGEFFTSSVEQQSFIREKLRANEPGKAHLLLAELARLKVLRCIITTNFDDLLEQALRKVGLSVQVIANDEDLRHSEPLIHCKQFRVYKPHGTIGVGRLRNTPADLKRLSPLMERELVRVLGDHGLMVLGYSGTDESILRVFRKRRQRFYPTFWVNPSEPPDTIPPLFGVDVGSYTYVPCKGASAVLKDLLDVYRKLTALGTTSGLPASVVAATQAIRDHRPEATRAVKSFMNELLEGLRAIAPDFSVAGEHDELLVESLEKTKSLCCEFANVASTIADATAQEAGATLYAAFGDLLSEYNANPQAGSTGFRIYYFDFYKFIGHELFVMFFGSLIREERWGLISDLLSEGIYVKNTKGFQPGVLGFDDVSENIDLLERRNLRLKLGKLSHHSEILMRRHTQGELAKAMPHEHFTEADFFLSMRAASLAQGDWPKYWRPWSVVYMPRSGPEFLLRATSKKYAERLLVPLGLNSLEGLRQLLQGHRNYLIQLFGRGIWDPPYVNPAEIASL